MPLVTDSFGSKILGEGTRVDRTSNESAPNTAMTVSTPTGEIRQVLFATVKYSGAASVDFVITLNSGAGASWDTVLTTIALAGGTSGVWIPDEAVFIVDTDVIDALANAVVAVTAAVAIYTRVL